MGGGKLLLLLLLMSRCINMGKKAITGYHRTIRSHSLITCWRRVHTHTHICPYLFLICKIKCWPFETNSHPHTHLYLPIQSTMWIKALVSCVFVFVTKSHYQGFVLVLRVLCVRNKVFSTITFFLY